MALTWPVARHAKTASHAAHQGTIFVLRALAASQRNIRKKRTCSSEYNERSGKLHM